MAQLFVNNGNSTLSAAIGTGDTTIFIAAGHGSRFPVVSAPDFCFVTLEDASGNIEIVKVTAHTSGNTSMTVVRAQQGTTARSFAIGDLVELRATAAEMTAWEGMLTSKADVSGETYTGSHDFSGASGVTLPAATSIGNVSAAEIGYLDGVTSAVQTQLNGKADTNGETYTGTHDFSGATAVTAPTKAPGSTGNHVATVDYANALAFSSALPGLAGNSLKVLRVNAGETSAEWALGLPAATNNKGRSLCLDSAANPKWAAPPRSWANWVLITSNGGTFPVPDHVDSVRAYTFGKGGDGQGATGGKGGGGGGCTFGTLPCKPGDVFTFNNTGGTATLKIGATTYLTAPPGVDGSAGGAGASAGTVGSGLGITASGAYGGGNGGNGNGSTQAGGGGASGSPLGAGKNGGSANTTGAGGGGWGAAGNEYGGGGVGSAVATSFTLSGPYAANGEAAARDWSNAFTDPLLRPCNFVTPAYGFSRLAAAGLSALNAGPGTGGGRTNTGAALGGAGGLGAGGGSGYGSASGGGHGGFGGGGGSPAPSSSGATAIGGNGGIGGGGAGATGAGSIAGTGGSAAVIIFY